MEQKLDPLSGDSGARTFTPEEAQTLLRECLPVFVAGLRKAARTSSETASDLFEAKRLVDDKEELDFLQKREAWVDLFAKSVSELFERRMQGQRRKGRRPDPDVSLTTLRVLNAFDQEKQAAIGNAVRVLRRWSMKELNPLDLRIGVLFEQPLTREVDNPFGPDYIADALGMSARTLFPNPRLWRPFMERVLADITPAVPKTYITLNRLLAERGVLPDIKAALRARSTLRPENDKDLLPLFSRLLHEAGSNIDSINVEVPVILPGNERPQDAATHAVPDVPNGSIGARDAEAPGATVSPTAASSNLEAASAEKPPSAESRAAVEATASMWPVVTPEASRIPAASVESNAFPSLDPMLALGSSSPVFAVLAQWQSFDPQDQATQRELHSRGVDTKQLPLNRIPYLRVAMAQETVTPSDKITMDVISLLFDYIFRDPSIPATTRGVFGRLQVPILKAALLDRGFFSDKKHAARRVLDRLASGAAGAATDKVYRAAFETMASRVVAKICNDFELDVQIFERADQKLETFIAREQRIMQQAIGDDVEEALAAEAREADRARARALVRDRLAGLRLPPDVRAFADSAWADYLTLLRQQQGESSEGYRDALQAMDDLLWSITAKERTAQKARLTRMVPGIIASLRKGCAAVAWRDDRAEAFFNTLYQLHIAAIKAKPKPAPAVSEGAQLPAMGAALMPGDSGVRSSMPAVDAAKEAPSEPADDSAAEQGSFGGTSNFHDYVSEMIVGTWLTFRAEPEWINARLAWISPLRTKYIFTTRARTNAFVYAPEDLAWELGAGNARLIVEPVPLFDRAVSAALDSIAAKTGKGAATAGNRAALAS